MFPAPLQFRLPASVVWLCAAMLGSVGVANPAHAEGRWWSGLLGAGTVGSGRAVEQARVLPVFSSVRSEGSMRLEVSQGADQAVIVRTDDNLVEHLQTVVVERDGRPTLVVRWKSGARLSASAEPVVRVRVPSLERVSNHGSGEIELAGIKVASLAIALHGSGEVRAPSLQVQDVQLSLLGSADARLGGQAGRLEVQIAGSGEVWAEPLSADHVNVSIRGSGGARVTAQRSLAVNIAGSGDVSYTGSATAVSSAVAGSGRVRSR